MYYAFIRHMLSLGKKNLFPSSFSYITSTVTLTTTAHFPAYFSEKTFLFPLLDLSTVPFSELIARRQPVNTLSYQLKYQNTFF